jgi:ubiquinone/menaquinone biosynthesis C-methylase UbiE
MQFKKPTGFWGKIVSAFMIKGNKYAYEKLIREFDIQQNDTILEIGYGPGWGIKYLTKMHESCSIYGVDFSELMFTKASRVNKKTIDDNKVKLLFGDFLDVDFANNHFDKIFCINVVYFWEDLQKPFVKIHSLLQDEGKFSIFMAKKEDLNRFKFTVDDVFNKYALEQVIENLKMAGFSNSSFNAERRGYFITAVK